jgi:hypothetical protein
VNKKIPKLAGKVNGGVQELVTALEIPPELEAEASLAT